MHGRNAAEQAAATARSTFETGAVSETLPTYEIAADDLARGIAVFRLLVDSGLATSLGEARRLIRGGGARVNDVVVPDEAGIVTAADLRDGAMKLSSGRKQHRLIKTT